jgi:hypothetical protein
MTLYVVDVCIAVKWYVPEIFSQESLKLLKPGHRLIDPTIYCLKQVAFLARKSVAKRSARSALNLDSRHCHLLAIPPFTS